MRKPDPWRVAAIAVALTGAAIAADKPAPAAAAPAAATVPHYLLAPGAQALGFTFTQEGAATQGTFKKFSVALAYDPGNLAASSLDVKVQLVSLSTDYEDRDSEIRGADILDAVKFPQGEYHAQSFVKSASGIQARGKLSVRGVTRDLQIPLVIREITIAGKPGLELSGTAGIKRLDYGVGQGEWAATETVANDIQINWKVQLVPSPAPAAK